MVSNLGVIENTANIGVVEPRINKQESRLQSVAERIENEKRRLTSSVINTIGRFKRLKIENPTIDIRKEEVEMMNLSLRYDDLSAHAEIDFEGTPPESYTEHLDDEAGLQALFDITPVQGIQEGYREKKEKFVNGHITAEEKMRLLKEFNCQSNRFTKEETTKTLQKLEDKIASEPDQEKKNLYKELVDIISERGYIFPEFSHGTNAMSVVSMLKQGILPLYNIPEGVRHRGEGDKINKSRKKSDTALSAGMGPSGLGLAMGYARREEDPLWRDDIHFRLAESGYVTSPDPTKEGDSQYKDERCRVYRDAYKRELENGNTWFSAIDKYEYPVVVGFSGTEQVTDLSGQKHFFYDRDDFFPGEVMFWSHDRVSQENIEMLACPKKNMEEMQQMIDSFQRIDIRLISLEALDLLSEIGFSNIKPVEKYALETYSTPQNNVITLDHYALMFQQMRERKAA